MLNSKDLYDGFLEIMNSNNYVDNIVLMAQKWTNVFRKFYSNMVAPIPGKTNPNLFNSLKIFQSGLVSAMKSKTVLPQFEILVQNLHLGICEGVTMTGVFSTVPPTIPLTLMPIYNNKKDVKIFARELANKIFTYVSLTFSVQTSTGATIKWI